MAHGREAARDLLYGRRGGRWVAPGQGATEGPPCSICGGPMLDGQTDRHRACADDPVLEVDGQFDLGM